jgi:hypothetical protein
MLIFDVGACPPFVLWHEADISTEDGSGEVLDRRKRPVPEFDQ